MNENDFSNLGEQIRNTVQNSIDSMDFQQLNRNINETVNRALKEAKKQVKTVVHETRSAAAGESVKEILKPLPKPIPKLKTKPVGKTASILYTVFGGIGLGVSLLLILAVLILASMFGASRTFAIGSMTGLFLLLGGSSVMLGVGGRLRNRLKRLKTYVLDMNGKLYYPIQELADKTCRSKKFVTKDIRRMIRLGMFQDVYLDKKETCIILDKETYQQYRKTENAFTERLTKPVQEVEQVPEDKVAALTPYDEMVKKGESFLNLLREANDAIPGEIISSKLSRLERVVVRIFEAVKKHPEQMDEMEKFMEYYLPTTVKLVEAYREFDSEEIQGENIKSAKNEIEETLNTINQAFERLLDGLYQDAVFDVSTDARVLQTMLEKDGWTNSDFNLGG